MSRIRIEGYASRFRAPDLTGDVVMPGAFRASLGAARERGIAMLYAHDTTRPIGLWTHVAEDAAGLFVRGEINTEVQLGREAAALLDQGALTGLSIGFNVVRAERAPGGGRRLTEIDLWEISLVTFPMLPAATARLADTGAGGDPAAALQSLTQLMRA